MIVYSPSPSKFISYSPIFTYFCNCLPIFFKIELFLAEINNPMSRQRASFQTKTTNYQLIIKEPKSKIASSLRPLDYINATSFLVEKVRKAQGNFLHQNVSASHYNKSVPNCHNA